MTNGRFLRQKADPGLALWLAVRMDCRNCPVKEPCSHVPRDEKSCPEMLLEWLEEEMEKDEN